MFASIREHPSAGPDRRGRPHLARTAVLLALFGAVLLGAGWILGELTRPVPVIPGEVTRLERPDRPPHPRSIYTPQAMRS